MSDKLNLADLTSSYVSIATLNNNNELIEEAFDNTLSRDGTAPNQMEADFDMNSNHIINLPEPVEPTEPIRLIDLDELIPVLVDEVAALVVPEGIEIINEAADDIIDYLLAEGGGVTIGSGPPTDALRGPLTAYIDNVEGSLYPPTKPGIDPFRRFLFASSTNTVSIVTSGALGIWTFSDYVASQKLVKNSVSPAPDANMYPFANGLWSQTLFAGGPATATDNYGLAPDGTMTSTRITGTGNWYKFPTDITSGVPDGTYTLAIDVKDNGGANKNFQMLFNGETVTGFTATSSWQTFTKTKAITGGALNVIPIWAEGGSSSGDFQVANFRVVPGASASTVNPYQGHIRAVTGITSYSGGFLNMKDKYGVCQFPSTTLTSFTSQIIGNENTTASYNAFLSKIGSGWSTFSLFYDVDKQLVNFSNTKPFSLVQNGGYSLNWAGLWRRVLGQNHVITLRYDNATSLSSLFVDNVLMAVRYEALSATTISDLAFNLTNSMPLAGAMSYFGGALYNRALTDAEIRQNVLYWRQKLVTASSTLNDVGRTFVFEGDSIEAETINTWPYVALATLTPASAIAANYASSGSRLADLETRAATVDALIPPDKGSQNFWLSVTVTNGISDYPGATDTIAATDWATRLAAYCTARKAAGYDKVIVETITPRALSAGGASDTVHNARRAIINNIIKTNWVSQGVCDYVVDFGGNAVMGVDAAASNVSLYRDGVHPTNTGYNNLAALFNTAISGLP